MLLYLSIPCAFSGFKTSKPQDTSGNQTSSNYEVTAFDQVLRVNATAALGGDGRNWTTAFKFLQDALSAAALDSTITEIWVATGTYYPDEGATQTNNDRSQSFQLKEGMKLYGGFAGTESAESARNPATNVTVLSGDIGRDDTTNSAGITLTAASIVGGNSYHVVYADGTTTHITSATILDGFIVTAGQANVGSALIYIGGGMLCNGEGTGSHCSPSLNAINFSGNFAEHGGGLFSLGRNSGSSSPILSNVSFSGNGAVHNGGALYNNGSVDGTSNPQLSNVSFSGNSAGNQGGAIYNYGQFGTSISSIKNTVFWGNTANVSYNEIINNVAISSISNSFFEGTAPAGTGNIQGSSSPFVSTTNLQLTDGSPAIDAGDNNGVTSTSTTDLAGNPRFYDDTGVADTGLGTGPIVDMGAYERQSTSAP